MSCASAHSASDGTVARTFVLERLRLQELGSSTAGLCAGRQAGAEEAAGGAAEQVGVPAAEIPALHR